MRLLFEEMVCTDCGACMSACPKGTDSREILKCRHCDPDSAPCRSACTSGAIKESNGILFIDEDECIGCGACAEKCPNDAIVIEDGKAIKCDLCFGLPKCINYCPEEALRFVKEDGAVLGWRITGENVGYNLGIPALAPEEQSIILEIVSRFREISKRGDYPDPQSVATEVGNILAQLCSNRCLSMEPDQSDYLTDISVMQIWGYGPLDELLKDRDFEEIAVIGLNKPIYVYKRGVGWLTTNCQFTDQEILLNIINKMARPLGRRITYQNPRLSAVLPDGSRIHASMPPISRLELTIRKFRENPISIPDLIRFGTFSPESLAFLWLAIGLDLSILITGNTASGKTSTLNALFSFVPLDERVLITEETPEINVPHKHKVNLLANPELGITMGDLTADSLRMRPDRVIVGEVRTAGETKALLEAITSGQARGSYATFHAHSAKETITRMCSLGIPEADITSIDLIVVQKRIMALGKSRETRKVVEISEIRSDDSKPTIVPIFLYDYGSKQLKRTGNRSIVEDNVKKALGIDTKSLSKELSSRAVFLARIAKKERSFFETVTTIQNYGRQAEERIDR
ncbi:MAG: ATPase, T2SS/T4P/T4SS family [Candidatus Micrarchaeota archaeon]